MLPTSSHFDDWQAVCRYLRGNPSHVSTCACSVLHSQQVICGCHCDDASASDAAHPSGEPEADAELQRPAAAALANLCSEVSLAERLVEASGMQALSALSESQDRQVQVHYPDLCIWQLTRDVSREM